ncbi:MAG TPA: BON domain-containing protein [Longimicrobiales bacterium]
MFRREDVRQDVLDEIAWEPALEGDAVGVSATDGAVTLTGVVRSYAEKWAAEKAAKRVRGVKAVANELEVRVPDNHERDDTDIAAAVAATLAWNVTVPNTVVGTVEHGWVTLEGDVDWSTQRRAAERAVRELAGVRGVTNLIRLKSRVAPKDIHDRIRKTFQRSAQVDADHIDVSVHDGTVTLSGTVRSWSERMEAEHAARAAVGVQEIDNQLKVSSFVPAPL